MAASSTSFFVMTPLILKNLSEHSAAVAVQAAVIPTGFVILLHTLYIWLNTLRYSLNLIFFMNFCPNLFSEYICKFPNPRSNKPLYSDQSIGVVHVGYDHLGYIFITIFAPRQPAVCIYSTQFFKVHSFDNSLLLFIVSNRLSSL